MMSELETPSPSDKRRRLLVQLASGFVVGALAGAGGAYLTDTFLFTKGASEIPLSSTIAGIVAMMYLSIALLMMLGTLNPKVGARFLNVEDEEELREQKAMLFDSSVAMLLCGAALLALALAAPVGPLAAPLALAIGGGGIVAGSWFAWRTYRMADELLSAMNLEAAALTYGLVLLVLGGWGMLAHLAYVPAPQPLDILTACYVLVLVATFVVLGRRGMLMPR